MDLTTKAQHCNRNFKRLYWAENKQEILHILSRVNIKYLMGLIARWHGVPKGANGTRFYLRYDGCQFQVSYNTIVKELHRRDKGVSVTTYLKLIS